MSLQLAVVVSDTSRAIAFLSVALLLGSASLSSSDSLSSSLLESYAADSDPHCSILAAKVLRSSDACTCPSRMTVVVRNGGSRIFFSAAQLWSFLDL